MSLESTSAVPETARSTPRNYLFPLTSAFVLAYAQITGGTAAAQSPLSDPQKTHQSQSAGEVPLPIEHVKKVLTAEIPRLDAAFKIREEAELNIRIALRNALNQRNPLPPDIHQLMIVPRQSNGTIETFARMRGIKESVMEDQEELPGRIAAPDEHTPLSVILERQFRCSITADDGIKEALSQYKNGREGDMSGTAFERLCRDLQCIPKQTKSGFALKPAQKGDSFRANGFVGITTEGEGENQRTEVFMLPDKGVILTTEITKQETDEVNGFPINPHPFDPPVFIPAHIATGALNPWTKEDCQHTPVPKTDTLITNSHLEVLVGVLPITGEIDAVSDAKIAFGAQTLWIKEITQQPDGTWMTHVSGDIWEKVEWPATTNTEDMYSYQLVAANRLSTLSKDGQEEPAPVSGLHFDKRVFRFTVQTPRKPERFRIQGCTDLQQQVLTLP